MRGPRKGNDRRDGIGKEDMVREMAEKGGSMKKITIVVTMGGLGERFRRAGYQVPKYMIPARGKTLFEWSLESLSGFEKEAGKYIFIAKKDEKEDVGAFVRERCEKLGLDCYEVVVIDYLTAGQAATAMLAAAYWEKDSPLLIYNIDTYVEAGQMKGSDLCGDGFLPCFRGEGDHWSFVRTDAQGRAVEVREKQRISDHCSLGAYYFKTCGLYEQLYREYYSEAANRVNGEEYVAPLYHYLLEKGGEVRICDIHPQKVHVLGTPEELQLFLEEGTQKCIL